MRRVDREERKRKTIRFTIHARTHTHTHTHIHKHKHKQTHTHTPLCDHADGLCFEAEHRHSARLLISELVDVKRHKTHHTRGSQVHTRDENVHGLSEAGCCTKHARRERRMREGDGCVSENTKTFQANLHFEMSKKSGKYQK